MTAKQSETSRSITKNVIYGFSTWFLPLGLSFIATPVIVKALGHESYGLYALVLGFIAYSFNFNVGRAITKYIAEYRASGENHKIQEVISATLFVNIIVGLLGLLIIILLAKWLVLDVLKISPDSQKITIKALYISGLTIFFLMLSQVFYAILQGLHRFDVYAKIFNFNNIVLILGNIFLAMEGYGLVSLLIWNLALTVFTGLIGACAAKRLLPEFKFSLRFRTETLKMVFKYSSGVIAYQILANVLLLFERSWITGKLGAENLTFYVVPMMLAIYIHGFVGSLLMVIFPLASEFKDDTEKLRRLYLKATKVNCFLAIFLAATMIVEGKIFLNLWMGAEFAEKSSTLLVFHVITFTILAILVVAWQLAEGLGFPNYNCYAFMICFIITVSGMIWLISDYGNIGVAVARTVGFVVLFFYIFYVEKKFFGKIQVKFWLKMISVLTVSTVLAVMTEEILLTKLSPNWLSLIISASIGGAVYCLSAWILRLASDDEITHLKSILRR
jgi:O-antigen/teichoic acid export membrane protein